MWDGAKGWAGDKISSAGKGLSSAWGGLTGWAGAKTHAPEPQHDR